MTRLPLPGQDKGTWGSILNDFLSKSHNDDGSLKNNLMTPAQVGLGNVDNISDVDKPISTATQTALNTKAALSHLHTAAQISDSTAVGQSVLTATNAVAARSAIGAADATTTIQFTGPGPARIWTQTTEPLSAVDGDWWISI